MYTSLQSSMRLCFASRLQETFALKCTPHFYQQRLPKTVIFFLKKKGNLGLESLPMSKDKRIWERSGPCCSIGITVSRSLCCRLNRSWISTIDMATKLGEGRGMATQSMVLDANGGKTMGIKYIIVSR